MFVCLGHVEDDPGEERPGPRAWHFEVPSGPRRHEPFRFPQGGTGTCGRAANDAGVAGAHKTHEARPAQEEPCTGNTRTAGFAMIVQDASLVIELLTNGALADS